MEDTKIRDGELSVLDRLFGTPGEKWVIPGHITRVYRGESGFFKKPEHTVYQNGIEVRVFDGEVHPLASRLRTPRETWVRKDGRVEIYSGQANGLGKWFGVPRETWVEKDGKIQVYEGKASIFKKPKYTIESK